MFWLRDYNENKAFCLSCVIPAKKTQSLFIINISTHCFFCSVFVVVIVYCFWTLALSALAFLRLALYFYHGLCILSTNLLIFGENKTYLLTFENKAPWEKTWRGEGGQVLLVLEGLSVFPCSRGPERHWLAAGDESSNINEVIRVILTLFFYKNISHTKSAKSTKSTKN